MNLVSGMSGQTICSRELSVRPNLKQKLRNTQICYVEPNLEQKWKKHSDLSPCCQIHFQGLASIGEDVESHLSSFLLQIRDKLLQKRDPVNLEVQDEELFKEVRQDDS